jgi:hypothetical protein
MVTRFLSDNKKPWPFIGSGDATDSNSSGDIDPEETDPIDSGLFGDILLDAIVESSLPIVDSPVVEPSE